MDALLSDTQAERIEKIRGAQQELLLSMMVTCGICFQHQSQKHKGDAGRVTLNLTCGRNEGETLQK